MTAGRGASARQGRARQLETTAMKSQYAIAISLVVGGASRAAAVQTLHAQAKPPVYMAAINEIIDQEG